MRSVEFQRQIVSEFERTLKPWENLHGCDLTEQLKILSIPLIGLSRQLNCHPKFIEPNLPWVIEQNGCYLHPVIINPSNDRKKVMQRESVGEPPIKGVRNGRRRFDEKKFIRKMRLSKLERSRIFFVPVPMSNEEKILFDRLQARKKKKEGVEKKWEEKMGNPNEDRSDNINIDPVRIVQKAVRINDGDPQLKTLKSLVTVDKQDILDIVGRTILNPEIHLYDFVRQLGVDDNVLGLLMENRRILEGMMPDARWSAVDKLNEIIGSTPILHALSKERIHPATTFETGVPLFFGMGGGSKMPCQGLPFDVLKMVLTGEKLRRELGLSRCFVLGADEITRTNIGRSPGFTWEKIDQVIGTEIAILNELFRRFGLTQWKAVRQSKLGDYFPKEKVKGWHRNIEEADMTKLVGGHHYAIEMADIQLFVPNGVKLGWFIRPLTAQTGYIMDEQPFHARFSLMMALLGKPHATTLLYTHAGSRLVPGDDGLLQKEAPYITYTPQRRLLLSPFEDVGRKLDWAAARNGGLQLPFVREQMQATVGLFEELIGSIPVSGRTEDELLANQLQFIIDQCVKGNAAIAQQWQESFPNSL